MWWKAFAFSATGRNRTRCEVRIVLLATVLALSGCGKAKVVESVPEAPVLVIPPASEVPEKKVHCACAYCGCTRKPQKGFPPRECSCSEKQCKEAGCLCNKWSNP